MCTQVVKHLFHQFDLDGGGEIDLGEMRYLLEQQFPKAPRASIREAMLEVHKYGEPPFLRSFARHFARTLDAPGCGAQLVLTSRLISLLLSMLVRRARSTRAQPPSVPRFPLVLPLRACQPRILARCRNHRNAQERH